MVVGWRGSGGGAGGAGGVGLWWGWNTDYARIRTLIYVLFGRDQYSWSQRSVFLVHVVSVHDHHVSVHFNII